MVDNRRFFYLILLVLVTLPGAASQASSLPGQITPANVVETKLAFQFRTGDLNKGFRGKGHSFEATPLYWGGKLYVSTSSGEVFAVDAGTGEQIWHFDINLDRQLGYSEHASRGVSIWHGRDTLCPHRIFLGSLSGELVALNADNGALCENFGNQGRLDLATGIRNFRPGDYAVTSPVAVLSDRIIVGSAVGDNGAVELEPGVVRALDPVTGQILWQWDPIPRSADDLYASTWAGNSASITGAANAWAPIAVDARRQLVFVPTSSPSPDFYGGERLGVNRYANSLVALDARTGEVHWHQQLVHHDVWDYDLPAKPALTHVQREGRRVAAVVQVTKTGMVYVFDRETGAPLLPVTERAVPASDVPGEVVHPTQPFSSVVLADHSVKGPEDAFGIAVFDKLECRRILETYRSEGIFTPPSLRGTIQSPSWAGGMNWGGVGIDPVRQIAITNLSQIAGLIKLIPRAEFDQLVASDGMPEWQLTAMAGTPYGMARRMFLSSLGLPCTRPPWSKLAAVDLNTGAILWEQPFGTIEDLAPAPVPNFKWGTPTLGGPLVTATDLTFIGATMDFYFRAFQTSTGKQLWQYRLPTAAIASPLTYEHDGKQYVAIAVGGHSGLGLPKGDFLMVFSL